MENITDTPWDKNQNSIQTGEKARCDQIRSEDVSVFDDMLQRMLAKQIQRKAFSVTQQNCDSWLEKKKKKSTNYKYRKQVWRRRQD